MVISGEPLYSGLAEDFIPESKDFIPESEDFILESEKHNYVTYIFSDRRVNK